MNLLMQKVKLLEKAWNEGDTETVLSLYTDDIVLSCNGRTEAAGKEGIAALLEMDVATHCQIEFCNFVEEDYDTLACTIVERNDFYRCIGLSEFRKIDIIRFRDGLICEETEACDVEQWQAMRRKMDTLYEAVFEWAAREMPEAVAEIQPFGELDRSNEGIMKLLALCHQWKASLQGEDAAGSCA
jgi:hypothetical protein